jgi:chromosome segregation ATPase
MGVVFASVLALGSAILALLAYWRSSGQRDVTKLRAELTRELAALRARQLVATEELSRRLRGGYEDTLTRIGRAGVRLDELRLDTSAGARASIDELRTQLAEARRDVEKGLQRLNSSVSIRAETTELALRRRVLRLEGRVQLLTARAEMVRAERLAAKRDFVHSHLLLESAVARVREVKMRLGEGFDEDPAFDAVILALQEAIRSVRAEAADHQQQIERILGADDSLIASLAAHEQSII